MPPAARQASAQRAAIGVSPAQAEVEAFYLRRDLEPIWFAGRVPRPAALAALEMLSNADADRIDLRAHDLDELARIFRRGGVAPSGILGFDTRLSLAVADWAWRLHAPARGATMLIADTAAAGPGFDVASALGALTAAPSLEAGLQRLAGVNPIYAALRQSLADTSDPAVRRRLIVNLERARALPAGFGERSLLVDIAAQRLEVWEGGRVVDDMPVVVGSPREPTPAMSGLIRFAVVNPYWHMPPDLAAARVAPAVLREGHGALAARRLEVVSEFSARAQPRDPHAVDWQAVADGRDRVFLRERPGPGNMMGRIKFIFPNRLGVYLHDTPTRSLFGRDRRAASSGCVRLSDAPRLARRLFDAPVDLAPEGAPEQRLQLPEPIPVYLIYLTARAGPGGVEWREDIYGRDDAVSV